MDLPRRTLLIYPVFSRGDYEPTSSASKIAVTACGRRPAGAHARPDRPVAGSAGDAEILALNSAAFPEIHVRVQALDAKGGGVTGLSAESLAVTENSTPVEVSVTQEETGGEVAFVIDAGMGLYVTSAGGQSRLEEMKQAILNVVEDPTVMTGKDGFYVLVQEPDGYQVLVDPHTPVGEIRAALTAYKPKDPDRLASPLEGVEYLLGNFEKERQNGEVRAQSIVVLSGILQAGQGYSIDTTADHAKTLGVGISTVLVRAGYENYDTLERLAERSGGGFYYYDRTGAASIAGLRSTLKSLRTQYLLTYRSPVPDSGTRAVSVDLASGSEKPALAQYDVEVQAPVAVILSPGNNQTVGPRTVTLAAPTENATGTPEATTPGPAAKATEIVVTGRVSWPDSHPRRIRQAILLVNGKPQITLTDPPDELAFVWNAGSMKGPVQLKIQVEDELGLVAVSDPVVATVQQNLLSLCPAGSTSPLCNISSASLPSYLAVLIAIAALVLVVVFRRDLAGAAETAGGAASEFFSGVGETLRFKGGPGATKAVLIDVDGRAGGGKSSFALYGTTTIGRSRKTADLALQADQADSPISRLHCTILEEDGAFYVRDEQSANGTSLNGMRLVPLERTQLHEGDEIALANPERGGVRLRFSLSGGGGISTAQDSDDSTNRIRRD